MARADDLLGQNRKETTCEPFLMQWTRFLIFRRRSCDRRPVVLFLPLPAGGGRPHVLPRQLQGGLGRVRGRVRRVERGQLLRRAKCETESKIWDIFLYQLCFFLKKKLVPTVLESGEVDFFVKKYMKYLLTF